MNHSLFRNVTLACVACAWPAISEAQFYGQPLPAYCTIDPPVAPVQCTVTRNRPVVTTHLQAQQVTTFADVAETQVCHKQVVENIPVTSSKTVTVDEGGYQMVWVPKPVTKQVQQTTIQQQVKTVAVPVQVTRRVPQISTRMVPFQSVQYVQETVPVQATAFASSCDTCNSGPALGMQFAPTTIGVATPRFQPAPYSSAMIPTMPAMTVPSGGYPAISSTPQFQPATPVAPTPRPSPYEETVPARSVPAPREEATVPARKTSMFTGVPSAAAAWQRNSR